MSELKTLGILNEMWTEQNCCILPCADSICRKDLDEEGGCKGAELAEHLEKVLSEKDAGIAELKKKLDDIGVVVDGIDLSISTRYYLRQHIIRKAKKIKAIVEGEGGK